ncbi:unnamed protein product [Linum trigynum]|uniref:Zinc finger PHD-type domain-containing protein n=1 Tax=Linum trigynum TaxID=586398 RepID=A0AAV2EKX5_9ROSI
MKGRSHRLQSHDQHEDWLDGSWTVDCICGVNFDDGEEMVNCDECGVWVHTRCSRYVKGDDLFACDKCKAKKNRYSDAEETEVAQLLVELPTKTIRMESGIANGAPPRHPLRLWTEMPLEEKVHVQGIPGGNPALFRGLSSVFTPELWKCTGYVPKKFNFQYREFPCWEKDCDDKNQEDTENNVDKGAGVLFSLSKKSVFAAPMAAIGGLRQREDCEKSVLRKESKKRDHSSGELRNSQVGHKKERSLLQPVLIHSGKRKKEDVAICKDRSGKKKARVLDKEVDSKKRGLQTSRTVAFPSTSSDAKTLGTNVGRDLQCHGDDGPDTNNGIVKQQESEKHESGDHISASNSVDDSKANAFMTARSMKTPSEPRLKERKTILGVPSYPCSSLKIDKMDVVAGECGGVVRNPVQSEQEDDKDLNERSGDEMVPSSAGSGMKHRDGQVEKVKLEANVNQMNGAWPHSIPVPVRVEVPADSFTGMDSPLAYSGAKDKGISSNSVPENIKLDDATPSTSLTRGMNAQKLERTSDAKEAVNKYGAEKLVENNCQAEEVKKLAGGPGELSRGELKQDLSSVGEQSTSSKTITTQPTLHSQCKMIPTGGKSSSNSSTDMIPKTATYDCSTSTDALNEIADVKQPVSSDSSDKKDRTTNDIVNERDGHSPSRSRSRDRPKSSLNSSSKASTTKLLHASASRRPASDSKDSTKHLSSKVSLAQDSCKTTGSRQSDRGSNSQSKTSGLPLRGEKLHQSSSSQCAPKSSHSPSMNPAVPPSLISTLSDEELALLLHQELNSSPRVPRVPRVRQATQLTSPTATSLLMKRSTSGSGGKEFSSFSRRKGKDTSKDGHHRAHQLDDEPRRKDRLLSPPDPRRQDTARTADLLSKRDSGGSSTKTQTLKKKNTAAVSTSTANSGRSSSAEVNDHNNESSLRNSPRNISDEETGPTSGSVRRTLPGLINEIMSKGKRMTYEELCNAVLPHWSNLRKHNGERYAYSSHSQAVLDCLRNRHEWARLVDRGPKTSTSRKRRKLDADESEDNNESGQGRSRKERGGKSVESQRDQEFPKGKRNARKRRRLALQGRGIKDVRKRQKTDSSSDEEDSAPFSNSSEESSFSDEEEIEGNAAAGPFRSDDSDNSSDEK